MKITDFNKEELVDYMRGNGEIHRASTESVAWKHAFKLYGEAQGVKLDMDCSRCWNKVVEWIKK